MVVTYGTDTPLHGLMTVISYTPIYGRFVRARPEEAVAAWTALHASYQPLLVHSLEVSVHELLRSDDLADLCCLDVQPKPSFRELSHLNLLFDVLASTLAHLTPAQLVIQKKDLDPLIQFNRRCDQALRRSMNAKTSPDRHRDITFMAMASKKLIEMAASHVPSASPALHRPIKAAPYNACQVGYRLQRFSECTAMAQFGQIGQHRLICSRVSPAP